MKSKINVIPLGKPQKTKSSFLKIYIHAQKLRRFFFVKIRFWLF